MMIKVIAELSPKPATATDVNWLLSREMLKTKVFDIGEIGNDFSVNPGHGPCDED